LLLASASCGPTALAPAGASDVGLPPAADASGPSNADCTIYNPVACRLDLAKTSVGIDVNYPNVVFCRLQIVPSRNVGNIALWARLASAWDVSLTTANHDRTLLTVETPHSVLEYPLGTEQLYTTRVTFASNSGDTLASVAALTLAAPDVSLYAVPLSCPGR